MIMRVKVFAFRLAMVTLLILSSAAGAAVWANAPKAASRTGQQPRAPMAVEPSARPGIYMAGDWYSQEPGRYHLAGGYWTFNWSDVESTNPGEYDWSLIDAWLNRQANKGKAAGFGISIYNGRCCSGGDGLSAIPEWLRAVPGAYVQDWPHEWKIPKYWNETLLSAYGDFIQALGDKYRNDPRVEFVAIGTGMYGETRACDPYDLDILELAGLTEDLWIQTVYTITDYYISAFSEDGQLKKTLFQQYGPWNWRPRERREIGRYSADRGVGLSFNGLYPDDEWAVVRDLDPRGGVWVWVGKYDQMYEYWQDVPLAWETYHYMLCAVSYTHLTLPTKA